MALGGKRDVQPLLAQNSPPPGSGDQNSGVCQPATVAMSPDHLIAILDLPSLTPDKPSQQGKLVLLNNCPICLTMAAIQVIAMALKVIKFGRDLLKVPFA